MNKNDVHKLARLAALNLDAEEIQGVENTLADIMALMDQLQNAPVDDDAPMAHPLGVKQTLRADAVREEDRRKAMQTAAPSVSDGLYKVPTVIK